MQGLSGIGQIALYVRDLQRAAAFYRDSLGMRFLFEVSGMSFFDAGGVRLMLTQDMAEGTNGSVLYFKVDDITAMYETLKSRGVEFNIEPRMIAPMPDHQLWMAFFKDSENNQLALMSEVR